MPFLALLCYAGIIASAYNFFHSSTVLRSALWEMVEIRRQLLVSPSKLRQKICSSSPWRGSPPPANGFSPGRLTCAALEVGWVKRGAWTEFCQNSPQNSERYVPRFYRLHLACSYIFAGIPVGLPGVEWEIFR